MSGSLHKGHFGSCCKDLSDVMKINMEPMLWVTPKEVLVMTIGYAKGKDGDIWFDRAIIYCPFCGKHLQTLEEIAEKANK
jgi:hypothetical protein